MIKLKNIMKTYGKKDNPCHALNGIDLQIEDGDLTAITGPSGSGKSTLLNILGCLDTATSGTYMLNGSSVNDLSPKEKSILRNTQIGFVVQDFALIDKYTVYQNVLLPIQYSKKNQKNKKETIKRMLTKLEIADKINEYPNNLSGGQKQRVAIARALINSPEIILADEPTGALDQKTGNEVMKLLKDINRQGKTVIIVTHDPKVAGQCNKNIHIIDGKIDSII